MPTINDTPQCDEVFKEAQDVEKSLLVVPLSFARLIERDFNAAYLLSRIYFFIAAEAIGEEEVRKRRDYMIEHL